MRGRGARRPVGVRLSQTLLIRMESVGDACVKFQAAGVIGNPWWFRRQRRSTGLCARVSADGLGPSLGCLRCGALQESEQFDREWKYKSGILFCGDLDDS